MAVSAEAPDKSGALATDRKEVLDAVLVQAFGWDSSQAGGWYNMVKDKVPALKELGVDYVWLPPPSESVAPQGYLPSELYKIDTPFGMGEELRALTGALKEAGLKPMADIVLNHRCAGKQDDQGRWNIFTDSVEHPGRSIAWGEWAIVGDHTDGFGGRGSQDTGEGYEPAPDIDHTNEEVREGYKDWLRWLLNDVGYTNFRFDYVKGFGANFAGEYIRDTVGQDHFNVGEFWADLNYGDEGLEYNQDGPRQALVNYIDGTGRVLPLFDFPTKGILQEAVNGQLWRLRDGAGKPPGLLGWWAKRAVTFIDNHDTGSSQQHWPFPSDKVMQGYAYILTHPGMPCILWEHIFDWKLFDGLKALVTARKAAGVNMASPIEILAADADMYVARVGDNLTLKLGDRYDMGSVKPQREEGWNRTASGDGYAVWIKVKEIAPATAS